MIKKGLVLEGGAMRGLFSAGVMDVMLENNVEFDGVIGVSAGACFGCNYKSNQPGRAIRYNMAYCNDPRYCSFKSLIKTGDLYGADFCYRELPRELDVFDAQTFNASPVEFYVVCTDVETGGPVYQKCDTVDEDCFEWVRASASMPLASRIVEVGGYKLLDGGMADSVPLKYFESVGYNKNVVVLTQPQDYVKHRNKYLPLVRIALRKYPNMIETLKNRHNVYNENIKYIRSREKQGSAFVICPEVALNIGAVEHDPQQLKRVYDHGRQVAEKRLAALREFLAGN